MNYRSKKYHVRTIWTWRVTVARLSTPTRSRAELLLKRGKLRANFLESFS